MIAWWNSLLSIGLLVALMVGAAMEYRDREGGWMSYGASVSLMLRVCMLGSLLSVAFMGLLYNVIDKGLDEQMKEITLEQMEQMLEKFDVPSEQIEEQMEAIEERDFSQTPRALITSWMISVVFGLFLALIASAFTKKNEPLFIDESTSTHE
jgi:FtsH-binding integral membrane protein